MTLNEDQPTWALLGKGVYRKAMKDHICTICGKPILKGMIYKRRAWKDYDGGTIWSFKQHTPNCDWSVE